MRRSTLWALIFSALGTVVVLWQMLKPGYVLVLDLVFGPQVVLPQYIGLSAITYPSLFLLYVLHFVLAGWIIEKIILVALFLCLFYFPLRFYPFDRSRGQAYFASLFFAINPFVYERMLAGQWRVLAGYALLFPLVYFLIRFYREDRSWQSVASIYGTLLVIGFFSTHFLVIGSIVLGIFILVSPGRSRLLWGLLLFTIVSLYWIVPYALAHNTAKITQFTSADWSAFRTAGDPQLKVAGNVAALYGFWGEHEKWNAYFIIPKEHAWTWIAGVVLLLLVIWGWLYGFKDKATRGLVLFLSAIWFAAWVFSMGVGGATFLSFNAWLFNHVWFWSGFRDSEKWSGVLALVYALLGASGAGALAGWASEKVGAKLNGEAKKRAMSFVMIALCITPLLYCYPMLFGFWGQLQPVWYPQEWAAANDVLKNDPNCLAVFLPWYEYYSLSFNNGLLTANPAKSYFNCRIINSANPDIGDIGTETGNESGNNVLYDSVQSVVTSNAATPLDLANDYQTLLADGVDYIIYTPDVANQDPYQYPFLKAPGIVRMPLAGDSGNLDGPIDLYSVR